MLHRPIARPAGASKTPGPKNAHAPASTKALCTTGRRQRNLYHDENPKRHVQDIEPQRLFKDAVVSASRSATRINLLCDKTNTIKKPKPIRIDNTLSKSTAPVTPHQPQTKHKSPANKSNTSPMLYRTPVTSKRARRPPVAALSPGEEDMLDDAADAETSYISMNLLDIEPDQLPDVEYGPPTACWEEGEKIDLDTLFQSEMNGFEAIVEECIDSKDEILRQDGDKALWLFEPVYPFPTHVLEFEDPVFFKSRTRVPSLQSTEPTISTRSRSIKPTRPFSTLPSLAKSRSTILNKNIVPQSSLTSRIALKSKSSTNIQSSIKNVPDWAVLYNQTIKELYCQEKDQVEKLDDVLLDFEVIENKDCFMGFVDGFLLADI